MIANSSLSQRSLFFATDLVQRARGRLEQTIDARDSRLIRARAFKVAGAKQLITAQGRVHACIRTVLGDVVMGAGPQLPLENH